MKADVLPFPGDDVDAKIFDVTACALFREIRYDFSRLEEQKSNFAMSSRDQNEIKQELVNFTIEMKFCGRLVKCAIVEISRFLPYTTLYILKFLIRLSSFQF